MSVLRRAVRSRRTLVAMSGRLARLVAGILLVVALAVPAAARAAEAAPAPSRSELVGALSRQLARAALPRALDDPCGVRIERPRVPAEVLSCARAGATAAAAGGDLPLGTRWSIQTPRWYASLAPLDPDGGFVRVHGYGDVGAHAADGSELWTRPSMGFFEDWGIDPYIVPVVVIGADPVDPRTVATERPYAVGDLDGDGAGEVAVAHWLVLSDEEGGQVAGSVVTVLDGRTGSTRWHREYPGFVSQLLVSDGVLVIANETGDRATAPPAYPPQGRDGSVSALSGLDFRMQHGELVASEAWSVPAKQWARWLAMEPAGDGRLAAAWMDKPWGAASGTPGHTVLVEAATGTVRWQHDDASGYPRVLRYDAGRDAVVVAEQTDPNVAVTAPGTADYPTRYQLVAIRAGDGSVTATVARPDAILLSLAIGDIAPGAGAEWIVGEAAVSSLPNTTNPAAPVRLNDGVIGSTIAALSPGAAPAWTRTVTWCRAGLPVGRACDGSATTLPYALLAHPATDTVVTASLTAKGTSLEARAGASGSVLWTRADDAAFPLGMMPLGERSVLSASAGIALRGHDVLSGERVLSRPLPYELHAAATFDVDGDGTLDVIAGGESGGVFAFDGARTTGPPDLLWTGEVSGPVHQLEVADLGGDGKSEVVAAATSSVGVLDASTGATRSALTVPAPGEYVWTVTVADVTGDGKSDVVVPTRTLAAYDGATGTAAWEIQATKPHVPGYFSSAVVTPERRVAAQFVSQNGVPFLNSRSHQVALAVDGPTGEVAWVRGAVSRFAIVDLWRSVVIDPAHPCGEGVAVGFTWDESSDIPVGWHPRTDFYDSRSGLPCYTAGPLEEGAADMGTVYIPGPGVLEFNWFNVAQLRPDGFTETHFAEENAATADVAMADFGPHGKSFLKAWSGIQAYGPNSPTGADGDNPAPRAEWFDLFTGRMLVRDLDGDGSDEVVAMPFDWPAYAQVAAFSGAGVGAWDYEPHGLAVLEAR